MRGSVSQMRPHSVSVWPVSDAVPDAVEAAELGAVEGAGGATEAVLPEGEPDPHAARTRVAITIRLEIERFMPPIVGQFAVMPPRARSLVLDRPHRTEMARRSRCDISDDVVATRPEMRVI